MKIIWFCIPAHGLTNPTIGLVKALTDAGHTKGSIGHLYYDHEVQKKTADGIRSFGHRTIYYGHGKPTDKF